MITTQHIATLLEQLIAVPSVSPDDKDCQQIIIERLKLLNFAITACPSGPVSNFWAQRGTHQPLFAFAGHTDVVPAGDTTRWQTDPFKAHVKAGKLYGRGAADMKGSLAAMVVACETFVEKYPNHQGSIGFLITSGEEGDDFNHGTPVVMQHLQKQQQSIKWCVLGEPTSVKTLGDTIKIGRRGSLTGKLRVFGKQGHVAYPHLAKNPIHLLAPLLCELTQTLWDQGNAAFPATSLQITNIQSGTGMGNVIPGEISLQFNFRYSTETTHELLQQQVATILEKYSLHYEIQWLLNGEPFLTPRGEFTNICQAIVTEKTGITSCLSTSGGTSDGRFIVPYGVDLVELGPINATAHQVDECVDLADLTQLAAIYFDILERLLTKK